jgi:hypothetical protein
MYELLYINAELAIFTRIVESSSLAFIESRFHVHARDDDRGLLMIVHGRKVLRRCGQGYYDE